ncbi:hypothetical protein [Clostridium aminobutyricum]|uniref:Uncharacterized protein n=1 Tax=Clostridium aminobutyricum TaxID=33953 RepID=A0A939IJC2_CLOAM|nr:hypothetical protein [Clostridium aminobutyricum]MBN7773458.1 hypothetical protein [Clostridium aminobutyricum]
MKFIKQLDSTPIPLNRLNLFFESRIIWRDFATWIHTYLASVFAGFGNQDSIEVKLKDVITKFGIILSTVFGGQIGEQYNNLIFNLLNTFKSLVDAQIRGDVNAVNEYATQLYENADQIAAFLARINPYWEENEWKTLLYQLNKLIIEDSTRVLNKEYAQSIEVFDRLLNLTSIMGDYYSKGIRDYLTLAG